MGERGGDKGKSFPLAMAQEGERVRIARLNGGHSLEIRLTDLGLNVGSELLISHRQGGQLVVIRGETRLALGASMAQKILVSRLEANAEEQ